MPTSRKAIAARVEASSASSNAAVLRTAAPVQARPPTASASRGRRIPVSTSARPIAAQSALTATCPRSKRASRPSTAIQSESSSEAERCRVGHERPRQPEVDGAAAAHERDQVGDECGDRALGGGPFEGAAYEPGERRGRGGDGQDAGRPTGRMGAQLEEIRERRLVPERVGERERQVGESGELEAALACRLSEPGEHRRLACPREREPAAAEKLRARDGPDREPDGPEEAREVRACAGRTPRRGPGGRARPRGARALPG